MDRAEKNQCYVFTAKRTPPPPTPWVGNLIYRVSEWLENCSQEEHQRQNDFGYFENNACCSLFQTLVKAGFHFPAAKFENGTVIVDNVHGAVHLHGTQRIQLEREKELRSVGVIKSTCTRIDRLTCFKVGTETREVLIQGHIPGNVCVSWNNSPVGYAHTLKFVETLPQHSREFSTIR